MKSYYVLICMITMLFTACKKEDLPATPTGEGKLVGIWKSVATKYSIGSGDTPWTQLSKDKEELMYLYDDGRIVGLNSFETYQIVDELKITVQERGNSEQTLYYTLTNGTELIIRLPCIEECAIKYEKIKP